MEQIITLAGWECQIHLERKTKIHQGVSIERRFLFWSGRVFFPFIFFKCT